MATCNVCGADNAEYHPRLHATVCPDCREGMPNKVGKRAFDRAYWGVIGQTMVSRATRFEFYEDYRYSHMTVREYIRATSSAV